jgi:hypothetical protein
MPDKLKRLLKALFAKDAVSAEEYGVSTSDLHQNWRGLLAECGYSPEELELLWVELGIGEICDEELDSIREDYYSE